MTDDTPASRREATGAGARTFTIGPSTSVEDILATLQRQGISDLEGLVTVLLEKIREEDEEEDTPGESHDYLIFDHYVLIRDTVPA